MRRRVFCFLSCLVLGTTTSTVRAESIDNHQQFIIDGQTSQREIRKILGAPPETISETDVDVWVYNDKLEIPTLVSLLPVVGDIATAVDLVQRVRKNHELIIQFDRNGIVRKTKLREMD